MTAPEIYIANIRFRDNDAILYSLQAILILSEN